MNNKYIDKDFFKKVLLLALPVSIQFLLHSSRYIADVLMLGQIGEGDLAAAGIGSSLHMLANSIVFGLSGGIGLLCAQYFGAKDKDGISKTVAIGVTTGIIVMIPVVIIFALFPQLVVKVATNQEGLFQLGESYMRITSFAPVLIAIIVGVGAGINAIGRPHINTIFTGIAVLINVFLNWILIFGKWGFPAMGLEGAAIATIISLVVETIVVLIYLKIVRHYIKFNLTIILKVFTKSNVKSFLKISFPLMLGGVLWHVGAFVYQAIYGHIDETALAVVTLVLPLRTIVFACFWGISSATGVILGHCLGANEFEAAFVKSLVLIGMGFIVSIFASLLLWLFHEPILLLFGNLRPETIGSAKEVITIMLLTIWILSINVIGIVGVLQSGADTKFVLYMDLFCQWTVGIPLCYFAAFHWGWSLHWVYLAAFGEEIIKLFIWVPRVLSKAWLRNVVE